tara:strand:- start:147 stop:476 length:330 start_codon:yes stop_codon:yes gene_type:complete
MANAYKVLGQNDLAATTDTDVYTVPASTEAVISTIIIANRTTSSESFRIAIRPAGATIADQHYIAYGVSIAANDSTTLTLGLTLATTDVVTVWASAVDLSVNVFGTEIS